MKFAKVNFSYVFFTGTVRQPVIGDLELVLKLRALLAQLKGDHRILMLLAPLLTHDSEIMRELEWFRHVCFVVVMCLLEDSGALT